MNTDTVTFQVAGVQYDGRQDNIKTLRGAKTPFLTLVREPDNEADPNAIKIMGNTSVCSLQVGYVPRHLAERLAPVMDTGRKIKVDWFCFLNNADRTTGISVTLSWRA